MKNYRITTPDGQVHRVQANSAEEADQMVSQPKSPDATSLSDRLQQRINDASIKGDRLGGGPISSAVVKLAQPAVSMLSATEKGIDAAKVAIPVAEAEVPKRVRAAAETYIHEPIAKLAEKVGDVDMPVPTPWGVKQLPLRTPVAAGGAIAKVGTEFASQMLTPSNLAMTFLAPLAIGKAMKIEKGITDKIKQAPVWGHFNDWVRATFPNGVKNTEEFLRYVVQNYKVPQEIVEAQSQLPYKQASAAAKEIDTLKPLEGATPSQADDITAVLEGKKILPPSPPVQQEIFPSVPPVKPGPVEAADQLATKYGKNTHLKGLIQQLSELQSTNPVAVQPALHEFVTLNTDTGTLQGGKFLSPEIAAQFEDEVLSIIRAEQPSSIFKGGTFNRLAPVEQRMPEDIEFRVPREFPDKSIKFNKRQQNELKKAGVNLDQIYDDLPHPMSKVIGKGAIKTPFTAPVAKPPTTDFQLVAGGLTPEQAEATKGAAATIVRLGKELVDTGMLSEETFLKHTGKYAPRAYAQWENKGLQNKDIFGTETPVRANVDRLKRRTVDDPSALKTLTQLKGAYPTEKGIAQMAAMVEKGKFLNTIASNPKWASAEAVDGWVQLPEVKGLGPLKDKWVDPNIAAHLKTSFGEVGNFKRVANAINTLWKISKTTFDPAVQLTNAVFNTVLADFSGANHAVQTKLAPSIIRDIAGKKGVYLELLKGGVIDATPLADDVVKHLNSLRRVSDNSGYINIAEEVIRFPTNTYQAAEILNKGIIYKAAVDRGMPPAEALQHAKKWGIDYTNVSRLVGDLRSTVVPFLTFPAKLIPLVGEVVAKDPMRIYKYKILLDAIEQTAIDNGTVTPEQVQQIHEEEKGLSVVMPFKDNNGDPYVWNAIRTLPVDAAENLLSLGGPAIAALQAGMNVARHDGEEPTPITSATDTATEKALAMSNFVGKTMLPALMPGWNDARSPFTGGTSVARVLKAKKGELDSKTGQVKSNKEALLSLLGVSVKPVNSDLTRGLRLERADATIGKKEKKMEHAYGYKNLTEGEEKFLQAQLQQRIKDLIIDPPRDVRGALDRVTGHQFRRKNGER